MKYSLNSGIHGVLPNHSFVLAIGTELLSFARVSNISRALECETFVEGGLNTMVRSFAKPKQQQETLVLEKGVSVSREKDIIVYERLGLKLGGRIKQAVTLVVLGGDWSEDRYYSFDEGVVVKWEVGRLDAMGSEALIESFEIAHSGLEELRSG
jgi:phage tail-like protein